MNVIPFVKPRPLTPERFWLVICKVFNETKVCETTAEAIEEVGDYTTGAMECERDHEGRIHCTDASEVIADKWLEAYGASTDLDYIPWFVKDHCRPGALIEAEYNAYENERARRDERRDYQASVL